MLSVQLLLFLPVNLQALEKHTIKVKLPRGRQRRLAGLPLGICGEREAEFLFSLTLAILLKKTKKQTIGLI